MTLDFDENGLADRVKFDLKERQIFIAFLKSELHRHKQDITKIEEHITELTNQSFKEREEEMNKALCNEARTKLKKQNEEGNE